MYSHNCIRKNVESTLFILPDYASTGIWCKECGMNLGRKTLINLPEWLFDFLELWNTHWSLYVGDKKEEMFFEIHRQKYIKVGQELNNLINFYYPCEFEERVNERKN